jgi:hypothetical protein
VAARHDNELGFGSTSHRGSQGRQFDSWCNETVGVVSRTEGEDPSKGGGEGPWITKRRRLRPRATTLWELEDATGRTR